MARKRMFDNEVINQDSFLDLPKEAIALYFLLGMNADDEGFIAPKKILRLYNIAEDNLKVLIAKNFVIPFESGVVVITDWKRNNYIDKNRITPTMYQEEKGMLSYNVQTQKYQVLNQCLTNVKPMFNKCLASIEENRIEENSIDKNRIEENSIDKEKDKKEKMSKRNIIVELYNSTCTNLPQIKKITEKRNKAIDKFLKAFSIDEINEIFKLANSTDFLIGDNDRGWKADFDFIMRIDKATAILEGKYDNKKKTGFEDLKKIWEEAKIEDEQTGNNTDNSFIGW